MYEIRSATLDDAEQILKIYAPYITDATTSFELTVPTLDEFKDRMTKIMSRYPFLVAEAEGEIAGYAYGCEHRARKAYQWSAECSVYISENHQRQGLGRKLYTQLFTQMKELGIANVFGGVTLPNDASVALHESMGFKKVGVYKNIGFKFDQWWDVGWWQLELQLPPNPKEL